MPGRISVNLLWKITVVIMADRELGYKGEVCSPGFGEVWTLVKVYKVSHFKYVNIIPVNYTLIKWLKRSGTKILNNNNMSDEGRSAFKLPEQS